MVRLLLIRHGQTNYNSQNRYCGFSDPPLNDTGIWQCRQIPARLKDSKIDKVYSSDLLRARQTAEIIFGNNSIEETTDLREMNFGLFEGLKYEQLIEKYLQDNEIGGMDCRFDVIGIELRGAKHQIRHIENAFWL